MKMRFGLVSLALFIGCDDASGDGEPTVTVDPIELVGTWASAFGEETITTAHWDGFCLQKLMRVDNAANVAIVRTTGGTDCGSGYGRVIWKDIADDAFDYCTTTFGAPSVDAASSAPVSAVSDDLATGCGGFPWSHLIRRK